MGPDRRHRVKGRALRAPINPSVSKGRTEAEPSRSASASSSRLAGPMIGPRACFSAVDCGSIAHSWGWNRSTTSRASRHGSHLVSSCERLPGRSFRLHSENTRCATGVRRRGRPRFPVSEISRHSNCVPACAVRCTGQSPPVEIVQHVGSPIARIRVTRAAGGGPLASLSRQRRRPGGGFCFWHVVLDVMLPDRIAFLFQRCCQRRDVSTLR
jgi:hypothetical protein